MTPFPLRIVGPCEKSVFKLSSGTRHGQCAKRGETGREENEKIDEEEEETDKGEGKKIPDP